MRDEEEAPEPRTNPEFDRDHGRCEGDRDCVEVCSQKAITRVRRGIGS
jgi:ferredoxin